MNVISSKLFVPHQNIKHIIKFQQVIMLYLMLNSVTVMMAVNGQQVDEHKHIEHKQFSVQNVDVKQMLKSSIQAKTWIDALNTLKLLKYWYRSYIMIINGLPSYWGMMQKFLQIIKYLNLYRWILCDLL